MLSSLFLNTSVFFQNVSYLNFFPHRKLDQYKDASLKATKKDMPSGLVALAYDSSEDIKDVWTLIWHS